MIVVADSSPLHYLISVSNELDLGERVAIALAELTLLIDESAGRVEARRRCLWVTGTLGVLRTGAEAGFVNVKEVVSRLEVTNFYVDPVLLESVFAVWLEK
jgi:predicted nucleic acid-binding protein